MKMKLKNILFLIISGIFTVLVINSCASQKAAVLEKSSAQLWGENCVRCHSTPSPASFNDVDWETVTMHMQIRANLTAAEATKIKEFMQSAN